MKETTIIREIINKAIPLNPACAVERAKELGRRAVLRMDIEALLREKKPYDPRTQLK